jgi:hypothetical protein
MNLNKEERYLLLLAELLEHAVRLWVGSWSALRKHRIHVLGDALKEKEQIVRKVQLHAPPAFTVALLVRVAWQELHLHVFWQAEHILPLVKDALLVSLVSVLQIQ